MRRSQKFAATALAGTLLSTALGVAGAAAETATSDGVATTAETTTDVELTIESGALEITAPTDTAAIDLGSVTTGDLLAGTYQTTASATPGNGSFGEMVVVDNRGELVANWTVTAWGTDLTTGTATEPETIEKADVVYTATTVSVDEGVGVATPTAGTLDTTATIVYAGSSDPLVEVSGINQVSWQPQLTFTFDANLVSGTYTGSIYHDLT